MNIFMEIFYGILGITRDTHREACERHETSVGSVDGGGMSLTSYSGLLNTKPNSDLSSVFLVYEK